MLRSMNPARAGRRAAEAAADRAQQQAARRAALIATPGRMASMGPAVTVAAPKDPPVRSEAYRRAVAQLRCKMCGIAGYSQAAHGSAGKGMAIKASDLELFPLCADRPGVRGCHSHLDQGALFSKAARREIEPVWVADTQRQILTLGWWPADLPIPEAVP